MCIRKGFTPLEVPIEGRQSSKSGWFLTGFTLIELLVVIAIIALLMAILTPSLQRVRKQAKAVTCLSNLQQWSLFFSMYTDEYNGSLPQGVSGVRGGGNNRWPKALRPYHKDNSEFLCCPMATKPLQDINGQPTGHRGKYAAWGIFAAESGSGYAGWPTKQEGGLYGSYGINGWAANPEPGSSRGDNIARKDKYWRTINVKGRDCIPLLVGATRYNGLSEPTDDPPEYDGQWYNEGSSVGRMKRYCLDRHDGFVNGLFMDFSIRQLGLKELWMFKWHPFYSTAGPWTRAGGVLPTEWPQWMRKFKDY